MADVSASLFRSRFRAHLQMTCRSDFHAFARFVFPVVAPGVPFEDAPHFRVLATALQKVASGDIQRLLIAIPPRHGKSIFASVILPCWILGLRPSAKIICASYGDGLARDFSAKCRDILRSDSFRGVFPDTVLEPGGMALDELRTDQKGYRLATSVGGVVTGKGADVIIVDDPMKAVDAGSEATRNTTYEWYKTSLLSRFDKPGLGQQIVVMQRLHQDDLIGRLRDDGGFTLLEMPGEALERQTFDLGDGKSWDFAPGDFLFPQRFDEKALEILRFDLGEAGYNAQILQRPVPPGGALFKLKHFQRYAKRPSCFELIVQSWDPAFVDSGTAAFTVCTTWGIWQRKVYLLDVFRKRLEFHSIEPAIMQMKEQWNARFVILEVAGLGRAVGNRLLRLPGARGWLEPVDPKMGKEERAIAVTPLLERKRVYLPETAPWLPTFETEVAQFPFSKFADQVDSMVHFLNALLSRNRLTRDLTAFETWPEVAF
jgi:predicted phage terminase large subunit-like protein